VAVGVTRNHGHFGAAGLYTRVAAEAGLIGYDTSGHQLKLQPGQPLLNATGGSPMSFAVPAGEEPPVVLDFGAIHDLYSADDALLGMMMERLPSTLFRALGLGAMCQMLGGFLAGVPLDDAAEDELRRRERRVHQESDQRHQPVVQHRFDTRRVRRVDVDDSIQIIGFLPQWREARIGKRNVIDVAEDHGARQVKLGHRALELRNRRRGIVERQRRQRRKSAAAVAGGRGKRIVDHPGERSRQRREKTRERRWL
jgi:hypothetical protein